MDEVAVLEWTFSPSDYFEETIVIERDAYTMTISNGTVRARVDPDAYDQARAMRDELHEALNDRFLGVQLLTHKSYDLSEASMYRLHPDGRRDFTMFLETGVFTMSGSLVDIVVRDKDGNIASDSRRERIKKKKELAELVAAYRSQDQTLASMLMSYDMAVKDPNNELVHLYEIGDALSAKFGGEKAARRALTISRANWSRLGQLANDESLRQGRHRGRKIGKLRDATELELKEGRTIARGMVEAYLDYLERRDTA